LTSGNKEGGGVSWGERRGVKKASARMEKRKISSETCRKDKKKPCKKTRIGRGSCTVRRTKGGKDQGVADRQIQNNGRGSRWGRTKRQEKKRTKKVALSRNAGQKGRIKEKGNSRKRVGGGAAGIAETSWGEMRKGEGTGEPSLEPTKKKT